MGAHFDPTVHPLDELRCQKFLAHSIGRILLSKFHDILWFGKAKIKFYLRLKTIHYLVSDPKHLWAKF